MVTHRIRARLSAVAHVFRKEWVWVLIAGALSFAVHAKYRLTGFGEQDAARLARDAISWHLRGGIWEYESSYRMHTSPGYIHVLKRLMDLGLPIRRLPRFMNWLSVALGTGCSVALYALWRQFSEARYAAMALFLYSMTPGFWMGNVYGMPTIPALGAFALALLFFVRATRLPALRSRRLAALVAASFVCLLLSLTFKADLVLCTGAFLAATVAAPARRWQVFGLASFVVLGAEFASLRYVHAVLQHDEGERNTGQFLQDWHNRFPFRQSALFDATNGQTIVHCMGGFLFIVLLVAILGALLAGGRPLRLALAALAWGLPPILFWGFQAGNHVRHSVFGFAPLLLVIAHFVFRVVNEHTWRAVGFALCLVGISYFSDTKGRGAASPPSNVLEATERLEAVTMGYHRSSRAVAASPNLKRAVVGGDILSPYLDFEVFAAAKQPVLVDTRELHDGPQVTLFAHSSTREVRDIQRELRSKGYQILTN